MADEKKPSWKERKEIERQDRRLEDVRRQERTPIKQDTSLSSKDKWTIKNATDHIDSKDIRKIGSATEAASKRASRDMAKAAGKKLLGALPFAGAAYGLTSGDPAMAAEEAAGDIPFAGQAYEALRPDIAGESPEDERMMLAEDAARKSYAKSQGGMDAEARREALRKLKGY